MSHSYQKLIETTAEIAKQHPKINSADYGRELEFDTKKAVPWARCFIRMDGGTYTQGQGSASIRLGVTLLFMDRLTTKRDNLIDVMNDMLTATLEVLATLRQQRILTLAGTLNLQPVIDYADTQSAGWSVSVTYEPALTIECYPVS